MKPYLLSKKIVFFTSQNKILHSGFVKLFLLMFLCTNVFAQNAGSPIDTGGDVVIGCEEDCVELSANFAQYPYEISAIDYDPNIGMHGQSLFLNSPQDDWWSPALSLPFEFCFFGESHDEMIISTNGMISFDLEANLPNTWSPWEMEPDVFLPSPELFSASIFGPGTDLNLIYNGNVRWGISGHAPSRTIRVSYDQVPLFGNFCTDFLVTTQILLFETTNIIEIHIRNKPSCAEWNDGLSMLGIQNRNGTEAYVPPGRNTGVWETAEEAWRFTPIGASPEFAWLNADGNIIGIDPTITVCPEDEISVYTARGIWTQCNGDEVVITDDVTVYKCMHPRYCVPEGVNNNHYINDFIVSANMNTMENTNSSFASSGYGDYSSTHIITQEVGSYINFEANIEGGEAGFRIWVDWNRDGIFDTENEVAHQSSEFNISHTGSFIVPEDAEPGVTRMRIVSHVSSSTGDADPCDTDFAFGEFEDYSFVVENRLNINKDNKNNLLVYPNPTTSEWNLSADTPIDNVTVYNLLGQTLNSFSPHSNETSIDASKFPSGTYIVQTIIEGTTNIRKVIKR